jgi:hypothetical protein
MFIEHVGGIFERVINTFFFSTLKVKTMMVIYNSIDYRNHGTCSEKLALKVRDVGKIINNIRTQNHDISVDYEI